MNAMTLIPEQKPNPPKPKISREAKMRIRHFVGLVQDLQKKYGIEIATQDDSIVFRDMRRNDDWIDESGTSYGEWDAQIFDTDGNIGRLRSSKINFEKFDGWNK
jgi:hypothetical protein